jgi:GNAT superfamily N-acetyltransferase
VSEPGAFRVYPWTTTDKLDDILAVVHVAFADLQPPSGALRETLTDVGNRQRDGIVLVAQSGDELIGSLYAARKDDALYLTRLAVVPAWRRRGVGRALVREAEAQACRIGATRLILRVRVNLPDNHAYFQAMGFTRTDEGQDPGRPPYYVMERPVVIMGSEITG